jgi:hypothetical protein
MQDLFIRFFTLTHVMEYVLIIAVLFPPSDAKQSAYKKGSASGGREQGTHTNANTNT